MSKVSFRQTWWQDNLRTEMATFRKWIGDFSATSKVFSRRHIAAAGYRSLLDCGCGVCTEYYGYKSDGYDIQYRGVDATPLLVDQARQEGIDVVCGYIEELPFPDRAVDVVYIRHVLEHLPGYRDAIGEAIRVARKEVLIVFFMKPRKGKDIISYDPALNLYHNKYGRSALERYIHALPRVRELTWMEVTAMENALSIRLTD